MVTILEYSALATIICEFKASVCAAHDKLNRVGTKTAHPVIASESTFVPNVKTAAHSDDTETQRFTDVAAAVPSGSLITPNPKANILVPGSRMDTGTLFAIHTDSKLAPWTARCKKGIIDRPAANLLKNQCYTVSVAERVRSHIVNNFKKK